MDHVKPPCSSGCSVRVTVTVPVLSDVSISFFSHTVPASYAMSPVVSSPPVSGPSGIDSLKEPPIQTDSVSTATLAAALVPVSPESSTDIVGCWPLR